MPRKKHRTKRSSSLSRRGTKSKKRSVAARRGWVKRTRKEGFRQTLSASASMVSQAYSYVKVGKDFAMGIYKLVNPRGYRKHRILRRIDKSI